MISALNRKYFLSLVQRYWKEYLLTGLFGGIPTPIGMMIRNVIYRSSFARIGKSVHIHPGVQCFGTQAIELGDHVRIFQGAFLKSKGNRICLKDHVTIDRGVIIDADQGYEGYIELGEGTYIGAYTCIAGPGSLKIGKHCLIAAHSSLFAGNHIFSDPNKPIVEQGDNCEGIVIEDDCWLGSGVRVVDGVTIGKGSVIGAGAVVTRNVPPYSIAVGVPAKVIGHRGQEVVSLQSPLQSQS